MSIGANERRTEIAFILSVLSAVDPCDSAPCLSGATCTGGVDTFTCDCVAGYTGDTCETGNLAILCVDST